MLQYRTYFSQSSHVDALVLEYFVDVGAVARYLRSEPACRTPLRRKYAAYTVPDVKHPCCHSQPIHYAQAPEYGLGRLRGKTVQLSEWGNVPARVCARIENQGVGTPSGPSAVRS